MFAFSLSAYPSRFNASLTANVRARSLTLHSLHPPQLGQSHPPEAAAAATAEQTPPVDQEATCEPSPLHVPTSHVPANAGVDTSTLAISRAPAQKRALKPNRSAAARTPCAPTNAPPKVRKL